MSTKITDSISTRFHSGDFSKTPSTIPVCIPDCLIHRNVENSGVEGDYSSERKHPVFIANLPSHAISMTLGGLLPGGKTNRHRHTYETIIYIIEGCGYSHIEDRRINWEAGDAIYIPVWAWHHHVNLDTVKSAKYVACENAPMLQNMGMLAVREEQA
jgi:gentisate 1,2-dioxygenase